MLPRRSEDLGERARSSLTAWWARDRSNLEGAQVELSVCLELFEADLSKEPPWYRHFYEQASPWRKFKIFLSAMKLPEFGVSTESDLVGLSFEELELVWLAIHLDYMTGGENEEDPDERACRARHARNVQMILMHRLTRVLCRD